MNNSMASSNQSARCYLWNFRKAVIWCNKVSYPGFQLPRLGPFWAARVSRIYIPFLKEESNTEMKFLRSNSIYIESELWPFPRQCETPLGLVPFAKDKLSQQRGGIIGQRLCCGMTSRHVEHCGAFQNLPNTASTLHNLSNFQNCLEHSRTLRNP